MTHTITKDKLFLGILAFILIVNILVLFDLNQFYIRAILGFVFTITIPGLLIMLMLKIREVGFWEYLVYTVGLSVAFIMFGGLAVNWILPWVGITDKPLALYPIIMCFDIFLVAFWIIAYRRNSDLEFKPKVPKFSWLDRIFIVVPMCFPFMAVIGAFLLNNHGTNLVTMIMLGAIAVYVFLVVLLRDKLNENIFPWALWMIGLSLLLMFSMRGWHIPATADIGQEYYVFSLTNKYSHWSIEYFKDAYNACLSITILPAIFQNILWIKKESIFKIFFPLAFSLMSINIYLISKRYLKTILAFISGFFFISVSYFFTQLSILPRQQIATYLFSLIILVLFCKEIGPRIKNFLFIIFGFGMVVSHYSTSYIALALFLSTYILTLLYKKHENRKVKHGKIKPEDKAEIYLSGTLVLLLLIFGFLWLSQLTQVSSGVVNVIGNTIKNIDKTFSEDLKIEEASPINQFNIFYKEKNPSALLENYTTETITEYTNRTDLKLYPSKAYENYQPEINYYPILSSKLDWSLTSKIYLFMKIVDRLPYLLILIGVAYLFFMGSRKSKVNLEYELLVFCAFIIITAMAILPIVTLKYPIERLYQQLLVVFSPIAVLGGTITIKFLKEKKKPLAIIIFFLIYFLSSSGIIVQVIGNSDTVMQLNNLGGTYNTLYPHEEEVRGIRWFSQSYETNQKIYADKAAKRKLMAFGDMSNRVSMNLIPAIIDTQAYVYSGHTNKILGGTTSLFNGVYLNFNFPSEFLNDNKNKIYSNGGSEIFK